jgi:hypothetical protein
VKKWFFRSSRYANFRPPADRHCGGHPWDKLRFGGKKGRAKWGRKKKTPNLIPINGIWRDWICRRLQLPGARDAYRAAGDHLLCGFSDEIAVAATTDR